MNEQRHGRDSESAFTRKLSWTILFGLVFGAGLVTGQRLLRNQSNPPLISVQPDDSSESQTRDDESSGSESESSESGDPVFSFYDRLSDGLDDSGEKSEGAPPATSSPSESASKSGGDDDATSAKYTLQVSAYPERQRARSRVRRLEKMGLDPYVVTAELPEKGTYYRVRIGKFSSMEKARTFQRELERKRGVETAVTPL